MTLAFVILISVLGFYPVHGSPLPHSSSRGLVAIASEAPLEPCEQALINQGLSMDGEFHTLLNPFEAQFQIREPIAAHLADSKQSSPEKYEMFFVESQLRSLERRLLRWELASFIVSKFSFLQRKQSQMWFRRQALMTDLSEQEWRLGQSFVSENVREALKTPARELIQNLYPGLKDEEIQCIATRRPFYYHDGRLDAKLPLVRQADSFRAEFKTYPSLFLLDCKIDRMTTQGREIDYPAMVLQGLWREDAQLVIFGGKLLRIEE